MPPPFLIPSYPQLMILFMQMELKYRDAYRTEMVQLIKKTKKAKGGILTREGTQPSGQLPPPQTLPAAQKRQIDKPANAAKRSPEKVPPQSHPQNAPTQQSTGRDKTDGGRTALQKMLPVEADGCTLLLDVGTLTSMQDVITAVKQLHSTLEWSQVCTPPAATLVSLFVLP